MSRKAQRLQETPPPARMESLPADRNAYAEIKPATAKADDDRSIITAAVDIGSESPAQHDPGSTTTEPDEAAAPPQPSVSDQPGQRGEVGAPFKPLNRKLSKSDPRRRDQSPHGKPFKPVVERLPETPIREPRKQEGFGAPFKPTVPAYVHGIACPKCKCRHFASVEESRPRGNIVRRKRVCKNCHNAFVTNEKIEIEPPQQKAA